MIRAQGRGLALDALARALLALARRSGFTDRRLLPELRRRGVIASLREGPEVRPLTRPRGTALELRRHAEKEGISPSEGALALASFCSALAGLLASRTYVMPPALPPEPACIRLAAGLGMPVRLSEDLPAPQPEALILLGLLAKAYLSSSGALLVKHHEAQDWGREGSLLVALAEELEAPPAEQLDVVESSLDDVSPAQLAHIASRLLKRGAYDAQIFPYVGKKGRLGSSLRVLAPAGLGPTLAHLLLREGLTLGARVQTALWVKAPRELVKLRLTTPWGVRSVRVKVAYDEHGRLLRIRPEHEDIVSLCEETGEGYERVRQVLEAEALRRLTASFLGGGKKATT